MAFLEIRDLSVEYKTGKDTIRAVNGVSLDIEKGEILAVAGESGCGKSTLAKSIMLLQPVKSGKIIFEGQDILQQKNLKDFRKKVQMIFQNPYSSLDPKMKIIDTLREPLKINTDFSKDKTDEIVKDIISKTGLQEECLNLYPHEFSGGQRQRIAIARALVLQPEFILADEPVSALDVSIQAQIINLLKELKEHYNLTFLFISHDLSVIKYLADRVAVMYLGEILEIGKKEEIFYDARHPYTKALLASVPSVNREKKTLLKGDLPSLSPSGCPFHPRCPECRQICREKHPNLVKISDTHFVSCYCE